MKLTQSRAQLTHFFALDAEMKRCALERSNQTHSVPNRTEIINYLVTNRKVKRYLEIGVRNPADNFDRILVKEKVSVDPGEESKTNPVDYKMTSDEFYAHWKTQRMPTFDLIFIDGLHLADQVARDINNSLEMSNNSAVIVLHDCNPPSQNFAREDYLNHNTPAGSAWNGTTYKAAWEFAFAGQYEMRVIDTDWGVGVIDKPKKKTKKTKSESLL